MRGLPALRLSRDRYTVAQRAAGSRFSRRSLRFQRDSNMASIRTRIAMNCRATRQRMSFWLVFGLAPRLIFHSPASRTTNTTATANEVSDNNAVVMVSPSRRRTRCPRTRFVNNFSTRRPAKVRARGRCAVYCSSWRLATIALHNNCRNLPAESAGGHRRLIAGLLRRQRARV